ncbi:MAG: NAD-dependent epimerase/dehydratase family protein [Planctomycetes bacterium]|nr:NAD-dependent epimerase/dehydratase family protein [Planctomycetota bacterium]
MATSTRRSFLGVAAAASAGLALPRGRQIVSPARIAPMHILVLGGTAFLGPPFVRAALANGHKVTLFNRGKTNPGMFPDLEKLVGDREKGDLKSLAGRRFDAVVDTSGYVPAHVEATAKLFADTCKHYTFISSISVYGAFGERAEVIDENGDTGKVSDEDTAKVSTIRQSMPFYGPLKARCEAAAEAAMPGKVANIRPGLIVGPGDPTDRFTWWPVRIDRGGEVLCPGDRDGLVQAIDVRDLAEWMLHCIENQVVGVYNATGWAGPVTMHEFLGACKAATSNPVTLTWASEEFLHANAVGAWMEMPMWLPREGRSIAKVDKAIAAGLKFRPVADTIRDTLHWAKTERGERPFARTGVKAEKEQALLAKWHAEQKGGEKK